jgi:hypothetical protein
MGLGLARPVALMVGQEESFVKLFEPAAPSPLKDGLQTGARRI